MNYQSVHGGDIYSQDLSAQKRVLDFSANINPLGLSLRVRQALENSIRDCVHYPDPYCRKLTAALAAYHQVPEAWLQCGNGAADVLFRITRALAAKRALLLAPSFADYAKALTAAGTKIDVLPLREADGFAATPKLLHEIHANTDVVVLCNPNNPTGVLLDPELLRQAAKKCHEKGHWLLVDECFLDLVDGGEARSLVPLLQAYPRLIILKAFTKSFAMPGVRLGYALCANTELLEKARTLGQDWSVSVPAQAAGLAALQDAQEGYLEKSRELLAQEKAYLCDMLTHINMKVYGSAANYIFFKNEYPLNLATDLRPYGILIRDCSNYPGLGEGYYRVAVMRRTQNRRLISVMKEVIKHALVNGHY